MNYHDYVRYNGVVIVMIIIIVGIVVVVIVIAVIIIAVVIRILTLYLVNRSSRLGHVITQRAAMVAGMVQ